MGEPDFKAFEDFVRAGNNAPLTLVQRNTQGPTTHYMQINLGAYAAVKPDQQSAVQTKLMTHLDQSGAPEGTKKAWGDALDEAATQPTLSEHGGGLSIQKLAFFITDPRSIRQTQMIEDVLQKDVTKDMTSFDHHAQEKLRRHEAAHMTLGLDEPGSDFVAAATMLRDMPESRKMLENEADIRMVHGFQGGVPVLESYGVECHDAIKRALAMTPEELKNASTETLYAIGMEYDTQNALNRSLGPESAEGKILHAITTESSKAAFEGLLKRQWDVVANGTETLQIEMSEVIRRNSAIPEAMMKTVEKMQTDDPEVRRVSDALKESYKRLDRYTEPNTPAPAPKPELQTTPALAN